MDFQEKQILPPKSWELFEELCLVLFRAIWQDPAAQKNGRRGQSQHGVDIFGEPGKIGNVFHGIQCKGKDAGYGSILTTDEIDREVVKAERFTPAIKDLIFATTAPRDTRLQEYARSLSKTRADRGVFTVHVLAWEDIQSLLAEHPSIIERFYPEQAFDMPALLNSVQTMPRGQDITDILALVQNCIGEGRLLSPAHSTKWRPITFNQNRDLGPALLGRGLGPGDATACPRLTEADIIVRQLQRAFSARLVGDPGTGKSVCAYQAAHTLAQQGWSVVRLGDPQVLNVNLVPQDDKPTLFLVDNAHLMGQDVLHDIEDQACPTKFLLTVHTASDHTSAHRGSIAMDGVRAVKTIASVLKSNLQETLAAVARVDDRVGERSMDEDLERRIDDAQSSSKYPWQFCFVLGGGWRRANESADASRVHGADLILAIAAALQLASRDAITLQDTLLQFCLKVGQSAEDVRNGTAWLVQERLLLSEDDLRCPHQRFAAAIIGRVYAGLDAQQRSTFSHACREIITDTATTLGGARALVHELRFTGSPSHRFAELFSHQWVDADTLTTLQTRCWEAVTSEDRMFACLLLAELGGRHTFPWQHLISGDRIEILGKWMSGAAHPAGYGLGHLLNDISNDDKQLAAQIVSTTDPVAVARLVSAATPTTVYTVANMCDRIALVCDDQWRCSFNTALDRGHILQTIARWPDGKYINDFSRYCWAISLYDREFAFEMLQAAMPLLQRAIAENPMNGFSLIDEIAGYFLHVWDPLGVYTGAHAPDQRQVNFARALCRLVDCTETAEKISGAPRREFQRAAYFLGFFRHVAPKKAAVLCQNLDWGRLNETIGPEWSHLTHDTTILICQAALDEKSRDIVMPVIKSHLAEIQVLPSRIAVLAPEVACEVVSKGGVVQIGEDMALSWPVAAYIVRKFGELRPDLVIKLVAPHMDKAASSLQSKQTNLFDDADTFIRTLEENAPELLTQILFKLDPVAAETAWTSCFRKGVKPRRSAAILIEHCLEMPGELGNVAKRLRKQFPKTSIPDTI